MPEKEALTQVLRHKAFVLSTVAGVLALLALSAAWLWLPDAHAWLLALTAILALAVVGGTAWLVAATLVFYRRAHAGEPAALRPALRDARSKLPGVLLWLSLAVLLGWLLTKTKLAAWGWLLAAMLLLPIAGRVAAEGFRGFLRNGWTLRYFADYILLVVIGVYIPAKLIGWHPEMGGFTMQTISLTLRFTAAILLATLSWLTMASILGAPRR
ncbi:MAG: hypothetical protein ABIZ80_13490 [Bryobacteraceae bacterium]